MGCFTDAYKVVEANEGGFVKDPKDKGGLTYAGISRKFFPLWRGWAIVDAHMPLKRGDIIDDPELKSLIKQFYKSNFWDRLRGDEIDSHDVAVFVYDWYVNSGRHAINNLQRCVGVRPDGAVGSVTIDAVNGYHERDLLDKLKQARIDFYHAIVANDPSQSKFLNGWLARTERLA